MGLITHSATEHGNIFWDSSRKENQPAEFSQNKRTISISFERIDRRWRHGNDQVPGLFPMQSISIVLCTFNGERFLDTQMKSLRAQEGVAEIVVVDDGLTDGTVSIVQRHVV